MAAKHRKSVRRRSVPKRRWVPGLAAAAITATSLTTALTTGTTVAVSPAVELIATITPASSTAQIFASPTFYGVDFRTVAGPTVYGPQDLVPFLFGPRGIVDAIRDNVGEDNVVLSSGWGAGQTSTALARLRDDPALDDVKLVVLDNNTNRAAGGFWTTYRIFAPLLLTSAEPTPNDLDVEVLDVGYEYNINGNAPTYPLNLFALANSLVAYLYSYADQSQVELPPELMAEITGDPDELDLPGGTHYIVDPNNPSNFTKITGLPTNITYVTFKSDRLPLVKPLLLLPGGKFVAALVEPVLTELVNAGYKNNQPIPDDPSQERPMGLIPVAETVRAIQNLPGAVKQGVENVQGAPSQPDDSLVTSTQTSTDSRKVNTLANNSEAPPQQAPAPSQDSNGALNNAFAISAPSDSGASANKPTGSSSASTKNPLQQAISNFRLDVRDAVTTFIGGPAKKPQSATAPTAGTPSGLAGSSNSNTASDPPAGSTAQKN